MTGRKDIITEEEFTKQLSDSSLEPQQDSPGDSEDDAGDEFMMGMSFEPGERIDEDENEELEAEEMPALKVQTEKGRSRTMEDLPEYARGTPSNQPAPWTDLDSSSDTN